MLFYIKRLDFIKAVGPVTGLPGERRREEKGRPEAALKSYYPLTQLLKGSHGGITIGSCPAALRSSGGQYFLSTRIS